MKVLAFDTATSVFSVALSTESGLWYSESNAGLHHEELVLSVANELLARAGIVPADLGAVACMQGPGSFTGIRIGFSAAKGIATALNIPLKTAPTLDCMAHSGAVWPGTVLPVIDAKAHRFFAVLYRGQTRISDYLDATVAELAAILETDPVLLTGPGADAFLPEVQHLLPDHRFFLDPHRNRGNAAVLLTVAQEGPALPMYLRKSAAES
ncbi:tRNA (adenosine(37)-N6)-threonylcarbamoyltransferase complex dimerization subunit type 1 TsaB [Spirochaetia bacterium]|nr:tRNA (adenosine(37)-N6)-threonylcarbamoyltransferase complex dimerization subunit type 1 TsaB [Spirochaetia bacterium]GHU32723.1 tRNA (adenosine(37)-N6)-threonylcarbamoyltransferase complex dimerization subunit type 1 TsaB [Spirochaetia bacterium]